MVNPASVLRSGFAGALVVESKVTVVAAAAVDGVVSCAATGTPATSNIAVTTSVMNDRRSVPNTVVMDYPLLSGAGFTIQTTCGRVMPPVQSNSMMPRYPAPATRNSGRLVVLVSGGGSNLAALLAAHNRADYPARVVAVVSDRENAGGLEIARQAGVATAVVSPRNFPDRAAWDESLAETLAVFRPDLVVSAGFMRVLGAPVVDRWRNRVVNTHPALLPAFPGAHGVRDALAFGARITGSTLHVVDCGIDTGPVIAQVAVPVLPEDDEAVLHERIKVAERAMLVEWVGRIVAEGMTVHGRQVTVG